LEADNAMGQQTAAAAPPSFTQHVTEGPTAHAGNLVVIRDAQLDHLLAAHREFSPASAFAPPAGLVRSVAFEAPARLTDRLSRTDAGFPSDACTIAARLGRRSHA